MPIRPVGICNVNELFEINIEQAAAIEVLRGPGSVALRLERRARHHQRDAAGAGRDPGLRRRRRRRQRRISRAARRSRAPAAPTRGFGVVDARHATTAAGATRPASRRRSSMRSWTHALGRRHADASARRNETQPGDGRIHHRPGRIPRRGDRALESRSRGLSQRAEPALRCAVPRRASGDRSCACICAARAWSSSSTSCSASQSRRTARTASASCCTTTGSARRRRAHRRRRPRARRSSLLQYQDGPDDRRPASGQRDPAGRQALRLRSGLGGRRGLRQTGGGRSRRAGRLRRGCGWSTRATTTTTA